MLRMPSYRITTYKVSLTPNTFNFYTIKWHRDAMYLQVKPSICVYTYVFNE